jgi:hypothetical protein
VVESVVSYGLLTDATGAMIPRIFHQIWIGSAIQHPHFVRWREGWKRLHPGWTFKLWIPGPAGMNSDILVCNGERLRSRHADLIRRSCNIAQRADIWRQEILLAQGGIYLDTDVEPIKNMDHLLVGHDAVVNRVYFDPEITPLRHSSGFLGAVPGHPWIQEIVERMPEKDPAVPLTLADDHVSEITHRHPEVHVFANDEIMFKYQGPDYWKMLGSNLRPMPRTCAIHRWSSHWYSTGFAPTP